MLDALAKNIRVAVDNSVTSRFNHLSPARSEEVTASSNQPAKLSRPLDFHVVADHFDGFGFFPLLMSGDPELLAPEKVRKWGIAAFRFMQRIGLF